MTFITFDQLYRDIRTFALKLPQFDAIIGVPRSGMIIAATLASHLNVCLGSIDMKNGLIILKGGVRDNPLKGNRIFIVDDSSHSASFTTWISKFVNRYKVKTGALYVSEGIMDKFDYWGKVNPGPRVYSWGFMNCDYLKTACVDMDGVLCVNPTNHQLDDGPRYRDFVINAPQFYRPIRRPIHSIVSSRMEKYRSLTNTWLSSHNVAYNNLILTNYKSASERQKDNRYAELKAEYFKSVNCAWFVESDSRQAKKIADLTGKPVICSDTLQSYNMVAI